MPNHTLEPHDPTESCEHCCREMAADMAAEASDEEKDPPRTWYMPTPKDGDEDRDFLREAYNIVNGTDKAPIQYEHLGAFFNRIVALRLKIREMEDARQIRQPCHRDYVAEARCMRGANTMAPEPEHARAVIDLISHRYETMFQLSADGLNVIRMLWRILDDCDETIRALTRGREA
jgi:hypothetical protein